MTTDSPYWLGMVERRTSSVRSERRTEKRPSCGRRFGDVEAGHQRGAAPGRGDPQVGRHQGLQQAIDAVADLQLTFLRFDVHVGSAGAGRVLEHRLQQAHDGRAFLADAGRQAPKSTASPRSFSRPWPGR